MKGLELALGKLPPEILSKYLLGMRGAPSRDLIVPPSIGVDFGVLKLDEGYLVVSSDPVTGVRERIGSYAVNVTANDIATSGNRPRYMQSVILLPEDATTGLVEEIASDIHETAERLGVTIVGGHTELTPGLGRPIVVMTAFSFVRRYVTAADARLGDIMMLTKSAAVEGTAILGSDPANLPSGSLPSLAKKASGYFAKLSVVDEAVAAYKTGAVHAMHDCTEGGILGAVYEMAVASGLGFELVLEDIPVTAVTRQVCRALSVDPLRLISSGTLLISVRRGSETKVKKEVERAGSEATVVGRFTKKGKVLIRRTGEREEVTNPPVDELWRVAGRGRGSLA